MTVEVEIIGRYFQRISTHHLTAVMTYLPIVLLRAEKAWKDQNLADRNCAQTSN
jgi:hypothetical protein